MNVPLYFFELGLGLREVRKTEEGRREREGEEQQEEGGRKIGQRQGIAF